MVQELLARAGKARHVVAAYQPGEGLLPVNGQPFQFFQKLAVEQRRLVAIDSYATDAAARAALNRLQNGFRCFPVGVCVEIQNDTMPQNRWSDVQHVFNGSDGIVPASMHALVRTPSALGRRAANFRNGCTLREFRAPPSVPGEGGHYRSGWRYSWT